MTSHNRRDQTLACLESLLEGQRDSQRYEMDVILVDAGSTDGTTAEVREKFPLVRVVDANDDLYWGGGMRQAGLTAGTGGLDFHLWLNDDVVLDGDALSRLLAVATHRPNAIVVGQLRDRSGSASYGGFRRERRRLKLTSLGIKSELSKCDTFNGNVVLVPVDVIRNLGHVDIAFPHAMGDVDYGFRAAKAGVEILQCPGSLAICERNSHDVVPHNLTPLERLTRVASVKRLPPRAWWTLCLRHGGPYGILYFFKPYVEALKG